jgi:predicted permease
MFRIGLPLRDYPESERARAAAFHEQLLQRVSAIPGVQSVSASTCLPLDGYCHGDPIQVEGRRPRPGEVPPIVTMRRVAPGWFETLGIRLLAGRSLTAADAGGATHAVVISQALAEQYFGGQDPLGKRLFPDMGEENPEWYTVVGVVHDVATSSLRESQPIPSLYFPLVDLDLGPDVRSLTYVVRTSVPPLALGPAVRRTVASVDPDLPIAQLAPLQSVLAEAGAQMAFIMVLLLVATTVALVLGVVGIYAVISYVVSRRTSEIGVRLALGARPHDVARMVLRQGGVVTASGVLLGLLVSLASGRLLESMLFGVPPWDLPTYVIVTVLLAAVAMAACWLPARRAARLDPLRALRAD